MAEKKETQQIATLKKYLSMPSQAEKITKLLGNSDVFAASLVSIVSDSKQLMACSPTSIMSSALKAAALKLPIDKNLGFAYVVPYKNRGKSEAQFQLGYKGYVQLAIRTGQYKTIHATEVYEDEFRGYNPITNELRIDESSLSGDRFTGKTPVGYYASFTLLGGFEKSLFMTRDEMDAYAQKYSQAYKYDKREGKRSSPWSTEFDAMAKGKMLKIILRTYGYLSIELNDAMAADDESERTVTNAESGETVKAPTLDKIPEAEVVAEVVTAPAKEPQHQEAPVQTDEDRPLPSVFG